MNDPVPEILGALAASFGRDGLRWYLFGAQAVVLWAAPRTSVDVDVTVELGPAGVHGLLAALDQHGFELRITTGVDDFVARARVLPMLHRASRVPVDVVLAGPGLEERFLDRAVAIEIAGHRVPVIAPEDLVVTKVLAGRPKDVEDVRAVLAERVERLDLDQIRATLRLLEEALGQSDLLPLFERELEQASRAR